MFALFGVVALSVVTATADHGSGGIVPTLQWTPRRGALLAARAAVIVATTTLLGVLLVGLASTVVWSFVPEVGLPAGEGLRTLGEVGLVLGCGSLLAVGLGLLTRSTAAALVIAIALILVGPLVMAQLPFDWSVTIAAHLPGAGALFLIFGEGPLDDMTPTAARVTLLAWAAALLLAGGWRLVRTDAQR
jgi:ABC-2 type transport system permease protein